MTPKDTPKDTPNDPEFDDLLRNAQNLSPGQRDLLTRRIIGRARAYRSQAIRDLFRSLVDWFRRRAAILELRKLDDRMLKDIGINRGDIENVVEGRSRPYRRPSQIGKPTRPPTIPARGLPRSAGRAA